MDNRDDEEDRLNAVPRSDDNDSNDWTDDEQVDTYSVSSGLRDDLSETRTMDFEESRWTDSEGAEDMATEGEDASTESPERDWLVDSGLAAAIHPESTEPDSTNKDTDNNPLETEAAAWSDAGADRSYPEDRIDDDEEDLEDEDPDDDDEDFDDDEDLEDDEDLDDDDDLEDEVDEMDDNQGEDSIGFGSPPVDHGDNTPSTRSVWPMLVGFIAVVLVAVGGWGLFEERAALQARITDLERSQSQAKSANTVDASVLAALEADNASLKLQLDGLYRDYELAMAEIAALQDSAAMAPEATTDTPELPPSATDAPRKAEAASDAGSAPDTGQTAGSWFVNIGAYSVAESAENLAATLSRDGFDTIVQEISTSDGRILLRVRVIGLSAKRDAQRVAADLEASYGIGPVWVGQTAASPE